MKTKTFFFVLTVGIIIISCKKEAEVGPRNIVLANGINIHYQNSAGEDLLSPSTPDIIAYGGIHVFNLINGQKTERRMNPEIIYRYDKYFLSLGLPDGEMDTTLLQLTNADMDTVVSIGYVEGGGTVRITKKVWYNGVLKYTYPTWDTITIVK